MLMGLMGDIKHAVTALRRRTIYAGAVVVVLTSVCTLNYLVFAIVDAVLLRPLPYYNPRELHVIQDYRRAADLLTTDMAYQLMASIPAWNHASLYRADIAERASIALSGDPGHAAGFEVSINLFQTLGVQPRFGRAFLVSDSTRKDAVVILGGRLARRLFQEGSAAVGQTVRIRGRQATVIGVMPEDFFFPSESGEFWVPLEFDQSSHAIRNISIVSRQKPARSNFSISGPIIVVLKERHFLDTWRMPGVSITSLPSAVTLSDGNLYVTLQAAVTLVLLLGCANVAALSTMRNAERSDEIKLRAALGATQSQLIRLVAVEGTVLVVISVVAASWCSNVGIAALQQAFPYSTFIGMLSAQGSAIAWGATLFISILTFAITVLVPTLRVGANQNLHFGARGMSDAAQGRATRRILSAAVILQIGLALAIGTSAIVLLRQLKQTTIASQGYDWDRVQRITVTAVGQSNHAADTATVHWSSVLESMERSPGVERAMLLTPIRTFAVSAIQNGESENSLSNCECYSASAGLMNVLGVPLQIGRAPQPQEAIAGDVAVVNQETATRLFGKASPIGKSIGVDTSLTHSRRVTIIGVLNGSFTFRQKTGKQGSQKTPQIFIIDVPGNGLSATMIVRTRIGLPLKGSDVDAQLNSADARISDVNVVTMHAYLTQGQVGLEWYAAAMAGFAILGLMISSIGLYGTMSYLVQMQTREIAVRMSLGATRSLIMKMVLGKATRLVLGGAVCGAFLTFIAIRILRASINSAASSGWIESGCSFMVLTTACLLAAAIPAVRASNSEPFASLR